MEPKCIWQLALPTPVGGAYSTLRSSGWIKEAISKKRVKREDRREKGTERVEWGGKGKEERVRQVSSIPDSESFCSPWCAPCLNKYWHMCGFKSKIQSIIGARVITLQCACFEIKGELNLDNKWQSDDLFYIIMNEIHPRFNQF